MFVEYRHNLTNTTKRATANKTNKYDAIFHMVTAAASKEQFYTLDNNIARTESISQATENDLQMHDIWKNHKHYRLIENEEDFNKKVHNLLLGVLEVLGRIK